ncbi:MAG: hypothetical protein WAK55_06530 [Xanthobacteraceae bacterium]
MAGPDPGPSAFHCATVPDGPNCKWEGGAYNRIEAARQRGDRDCPIKPDDPPINILGGYKFPNAPNVDLSPPPLTEITRSAWKPCWPANPILDDLEIPPFLDRRPKGGAA